MIICEVNKNHLNVRTRELLTAGSQNVNTVEFRFNAAWDGLAKTATFKTSKKTISVLLGTNTTEIPWEVLADAGEILAVGVFGVSGETVVLPTVWGILGKVMAAAHLGDEEKEPTPDVYQKILDELNSLEKPTWNAVQNKPFESLGDGLEVDENGVLSVPEGGGGSANAVQYVAQSLTDEQKTQARKNIGASPIPSVQVWKNTEGNYSDVFDLYFRGVSMGVVEGQNLASSVPPGMYFPVLVLFGNMSYGQVNTAVYDSGGVCWHGTLYLSSETYSDFTKQADYVTNTALTDILQDYTTQEQVGSFAEEVGEALNQKLDKNQGTTNAGKILGVGEDGNVIPQDKPTYTLPQATADALGGIKADAATAEDTQPVRIGADGKLKTKPTGGSSITVDSELSSTSANPVQNKVVTAALAEKITAPTTASVGQMIKVKTVDDAGKPTEWEAADLSSGGSEDWTLLAEQTTTEIVKEISFSLPKNVKHIVSKIWCPATGAEKVNRYVTIKIGASNLFYYIPISIPDKSMTSQLTVSADSIGGGYWRLSYYANRGDKAFDLFGANNQNHSVTVGVVKATYIEANTFEIMVVEKDTTQQFPAGTMLKVWGN